MMRVKLCGNIHRNVINTQYCSDIISPIIQDKLQRVRDVECLLSGDPDVGDAVWAKGLRIKHPNFRNSSIQWLESMRYDGGIHPDVQECIKTVANKRGGPIEDSSYDKSHNTPDFFNLFEMVWFLTADSGVMGNDETLLHGEESILRGISNIPNALELREISGPARYAVVTDNAQFFSNEVYNIVVF